jgi:hypothetical protein
MVSTATLDCGSEGHKKEMSSILGVAGFQPIYGRIYRKDFFTVKLKEKKLYFLQGVCSPDCKVDDHCSDDEYCDYPDGGQGLCKPGCRNGADCGKCGDCVAHVCQEPECCTDADCEVSKNRVIKS